jgi:hypothetical protein
VKLICLTIVLLVTYGMNVMLFTFTRKI